LGEYLEVYPHAITKQADLQEISLVPRPRDPLARISCISVTPARFSIMARSELSSEVASAECFHCRQACTGMWQAHDFERAFAR
jgi:hypothetical protein